MSACVACCLCAGEKQGGLDWLTPKKKENFAGQMAAHVSVSFCFKKHEGRLKSSNMVNCRHRSDWMYCSFQLHSQTLELVSPMEELLRTVCKCCRMVPGEMRPVIRLTVCGLTSVRRKVKRKHQISNKKQTALSTWRSCFFAFTHVFVYDFPWFHKASMFHDIFGKSAEILFILECPVGFEVHAGTCYKLVATPATATAAQATCQAEGSHLVTVDNAEENEYIKTLLR